MRRALFLSLLLSPILSCHHDGRDPAKHDDHEEHEAHAHEGHEGHDDDEHEGHDEGAPKEEGVVTLSAGAIERLELNTAPARAGALGEIIEVPASIELNPDRTAHLSPLVEGQILDVSVRVGDVVEANQPLATLRSVALGQARADLTRAKALRKIASQNLERQGRLRAEGISSERSRLTAKVAFEQADAERAAARSRLQVFGVRGGSGPDMQITSPIKGVVLTRHATRGESVAPGDTLFVIADLSRVWAIGRVYERQIGRLEPGMEARLTLNAYPGRVWSGAVDYLGDALEAETRTLAARVTLDNPEGLLRPGLFGALQLITKRGEAEGVVIPEGAAQTIEGRVVVFVPTGAPRTFKVRVVTLGRRRGGLVEVIGGLKPDERVVVEGAFTLKSELVRDQLGHGHAH